MSAGAEAADLAEAMVDSIPIVTGSAVIGIVSRRDLVKTLVRDDDISRVDMLHRLDSYTGGHTPWAVMVDQGRVES
jgi:CBS domain-containing protein